MKIFQQSDTIIDAGRMFFTMTGQKEYLVTASYLSIYPLISSTCSKILPALFFPSRV